MSEARLVKKPEYPVINQNCEFVRHHQNFFSHFEQEILICGLRHLVRSSRFKQSFTRSGFECSLELSFEVSALWCRELPREAAALLQYFLVMRPLPAGSDLPCRCLIEHHTKLERIFWHSSKSVAGGGSCALIISLGNDSMLTVEDKLCEVDRQFILKSGDAIVLLPPLCYERFDVNVVREGSSPLSGLQGNLSFYLL